MKYLKFNTIIICLFLPFQILMADDYFITLKPLNGEGIQIGTLDTQEINEDLWSYKIEFNKEIFEDHFLSMRPFKCLPIEEKLWCHAPYPYDIKREISKDDFTDLEYDLIFVWKPAGQYGIDLWNGVYYELQQDDEGWSGEMRGYDLGILGVPPEKGELRPIDLDDLHEIDFSDHPLPKIEIKRLQ